MLSVLKVNAGLHKHYTLRVNKTNKNLIKQYLTLPIYYRRDLYQGLQNHPLFFN